jgi:hypothetical protein
LLTCDFVLFFKKKRIKKIMKGYIPWLDTNNRDGVIITIKTSILEPIWTNDRFNEKYAIFKNVNPFQVTKITTINGDRYDWIDEFTVGETVDSVTTHRIYKTLVGLKEFFKSKGWLKCSEGWIKHFDYAGRLLEKHFILQNKKLKSVYYRKTQIIRVNYRKNTTTYLNIEDNSKWVYNFIVDLANYGFIEDQACLKYHRCELISKIKMKEEGIGVKLRKSFKNNKKHGLWVFKNRTRHIYQNGVSVSKTNNLQHGFEKQKRLLFKIKVF